MIIGQKVRLRPLERDDLPRSVQWLADPEVRQGIALHLPLSMDDEAKWYEDMLKRDRNERVFAIDARTADGWEHIGSTGFHEIDWRCRHAEFGIMIGNKNYWSQGFGADAVKTIAGLGFGELNLEKIWLRVFETNPRAIRCYEKAGFILEGRLRRHHYQDGHYCDVLIMGLLREEWEASKA